MDRQRPVAHSWKSVSTRRLGTCLHKILHILIGSTHCLDESKFELVAIGGMETVVEIIKTFPKCQALQQTAYALLLKFACCRIGKKSRQNVRNRVLLAAYKQSLGLCLHMRPCMLDYENTELFICLDGATARERMCLSTTCDAIFIRPSKRTTLRQNPSL
jgi:hypothetical protein